jgi:O-antigen/teichoic acid export membrane protein
VVRRFRGLVRPDSLRRTSSDLKTALSGNLARQGYVSAFDQAGISLTNFLAALLLARAATPTEFGVFAIGFILLHLVRAVQEGIIIQPVAALGAPLSDVDFQGFASGAAVLQLVLAGASAAGAALVGWGLTATGNTTAGPMVSALWLPFLFWQPQEFVRRVFYVRRSVPSAVLNTAVASVVRLVYLALTLSAGEATGRVGLVAIGWGAAAGLVLGVVQTRAVWRPRRARPLQVWRQSWGFGRWALGGTVTNWVAVEVYPILTAGMISFAAAGAYRALQNVVAPIHALLRAMDTYFTPRVAERFQTAGVKGVRHLLRRMYLISGVPILAFLAVAALLARPAMRLFYGETYTSFAPGMLWMTVFYALLFAYWPLQSALKAIRWTRPVFVANLLAILVMATAGVWAIARWGVYGTIAGQALNAAIVAAVLWTAWRGSSIESKALMPFEQTGVERPSVD